jgi:replicative DNA helicase
MDTAELARFAPPHSEEAERSVLGALLQDAGVAATVFDTLAADDFYKPEHREVFEAMRALHVAGTPIDMMTAADMLSRRGTLAGVGGTAALIAMYRFVPTTANTASYVKIVREKGMLRKLISACRRIEEQCAGAQEEPETILRNAERALMELAAAGSGGDALQPLDAVLMRTFDKVEEMSRLRGRLAGVPTGLYDLDRMLTGLHGGELVIVGARPGMGKTSLALGVSLFAAMHTHKRIAVFSMEMPREQIGLRILCGAAGINMQRISGGMLSDADWVRIGDCLNQLSSCHIHIDDTPGLTPSQVRSRARRLMLEHGLDLIVVDYLGLMASDRRAENRQVEVSDISRALKAIALELRVPLLACSQLARANVARADKRPMLSDLRDSGSIEQDADVVLFLHREGYYQSAAQGGADGAGTSGEIIVAKQRNGPVGTVEVDWQPEFARYVNRSGTRVPQYVDALGA